MPRPFSDQAPAVEIMGVVKWYDSARGYGFIRPDDGSEDILLHANCVRAYGVETAPERAAIAIRAQRTPRGLQAVEILSLEAASDDGCADGGAPDAVADHQAPPQPPAAARGPLTPARVKWFDKQKGFGFLNLHGDARDVFVHMEAVRAGGFVDLQAGEAVLARAAMGPRGLMAVELRDWRAAETEAPPERDLDRDPERGADPRDVGRPQRERGA